MDPSTIRPGVIKRLKYKLLVAFLLLNIYPFYDLLNRAMSIIDPLMLLLVVGLTIIWVIGVYKLSPHILTIYYVLTGSVLYIISGGVLVEISTIIIYSIIAFFSDYISKLLIIGFGYRWTRVSLKGLIIGLGIVLLIAGSYIYVGLFVAGFSLNYVEEIIHTTPGLFQEFFQLFIETRIGSLFFTLLVIFLAYFILDEYITNLLSDIVPMPRSMALGRIVEFLKSEAELVFKGRDDFGKLFKRSSFFIIGFFIYLLFYPLLDYLMSFYHGGFLGFLFTGALWFGLSLLLYGLFLGKIYPSIIKTTPPKRGKPSPIWIIVPVALLAGYTFLLWIEGLPVVDLYLHSIGFEEGWFGMYNGIDHGSRLFLDLTVKYYYYSYNYIDKVRYAYLLFSKFIDEIIKFLWG